MTPAVVVIAVGNRFGGDDGVAAAVLEAACDRRPPGVELREVDGEPTRLLDAWAGFDAAVVVDAARSGRPAGTVQRLVVEPSLTPSSPWPDRPAPASSHGAGLADAVELGRVLDRLPSRLVLLAVEGVTFAPGDQLSAGVRRSVPAATDALLAEVRGLLADLATAEAPG